MNTAFLIDVDGSRTPVDLNQTTPRVLLSAYVIGIRTATHVACMVNPRPTDNANDPEEWEWEVLLDLPRNRHAERFVGTTRHLFGPVVVETVEAHDARLLASLGTGAGGAA